MIVEFEKLNTNETDVKLMQQVKASIGGCSESSEATKAGSVYKQSSLESNLSNENNFSEHLDADTASKTSQDDQSSYQLRLKERELEKVREALKKTESRLDLVRYQPPVAMVKLLNKAFESEKALLEFKLSMIEKDKNECVDSLNKVCKRQSGFFGALKIAHSSTLEDIQHRLEGLK